jgi:hypothetical protein
MKRDAVDSPITKLTGYMDKKKNQVVTEVP